MSEWITPKPVRAAFFDADGTLLSFATHEVPESAVRALTLLRTSGVRTFLCTGRSPSLLDDVPLELFDACLTMSGQYCYIAGEDGAEDDVFLSRPIDRQDMEKRTCFYLSRLISSQLPAGGRYKMIRIWIYLHLGTGERRDCFITNAVNQPYRDMIDIFSGETERVISIQEEG